MYILRYGNKLALQYRQLNLREVGLVKGSFFCMTITSVNMTLMRDHHGNRCLIIHKCMTGVHGSEVLELEK